MNASTDLIFGYVFATILYAAYWISLRIRLSRLERKVGRAK